MNRNDDLKLSMFSFKNKFNGTLEHVHAQNEEEANEAIKKKYPTEYDKFIIVGTIEHLLSENIK